MFERLKNLGKTIDKWEMGYCMYCKHWGVVNWCNLKNKRVYWSSSCDEWEANSE